MALLVFHSEILLALTLHLEFCNQRGTETNPSHAATRSRFPSPEWVLAKFLNRDKHVSNTGYLQFVAK
jgi:hypothetical protein